MTVVCTHAHLDLHCVQTILIADDDEKESVGSGFVLVLHNQPTSLLHLCRRWSGDIHPLFLVHWKYEPLVRNEAV